MTNQVTDLTWLVNDKPGPVNVLVIGATVLDPAEGPSVTDVIVYADDPRVPPVRLTFSADGRLLVNGVFEVREDFMGLCGVFEEVNDAGCMGGEIHRSLGV